MRSFKESFQDSRFLLFGFTLICMAFLGINLWSSTPSSRKDYARNQEGKSVNKNEIKGERIDTTKLPIWNFTRSFRLVSLEKVEDRDLRLTLRNEYEKKINGFRIGIGNVGVGVELMYNEDKMIPPGGIWVEQTPIQENTDRAGVSIIAVTFEDGSSDGDALCIREIEAGRLGEKVQFKRALALIRGHLKSENADRLETLEELESQIASLPEVAEKGLGGDFKAGLHSGKERTIWMLQWIKQNQQSMLLSANTPQKQNKVSIRQELALLAEKYTRLLPKY